MNKVSTHGRSATIGRRCQMSEDPGTPLAGEDPSALETAEELAEIAAESITGWYYARGTRHLHKRRYAKAVAALRKCTAVSNVANEVGITVTVPLSLALYKLGLALEKLPDLPKATEALEKAIAADPGRMPAREALARVAISRQDYNRAINEYYRSEASRPAESDRSPRESHSSRSRPNARSRSTCQSCHKPPGLQQGYQRVLRCLRFHRRAPGSSHPHSG